MMIKYSQKKYSHDFQKTTSIPKAQKTVKYIKSKFILSNLLIKRHLYFSFREAG